MKTVLLKLSGEILADHSQQEPQKLPTAAAAKDHLQNIAEQLKTLSSTHRFAIVIGGGNFFRARQVRQELQLRQAVADTIGMLATAMNGLLLQEYFNHQGLPSVLLSAIPLPSLTQAINQTTIDDAFAAGKCIIFCGGTGNPYFTTDTTAIVRALQITADEVWKATTVDYVYDGDPKLDKKCKPLPQVSSQEVLQKQLKIMDLTAIALAQQYKIKIRIFNAFAPQALEDAARTPTFGSTIL
jgi:uridylate kinase